MAPLIAAAAAVMILGGLTLIGMGLTPTPPRPARPASRLQARLRRPASPAAGGRISRRTRTLLLTGLAAGLLLWLTTGWAVAVLILPAATAGLPALLMTPQGVTTIDRLEAMEEWTRGLSGVLTVGVGLEQAIIVSLRAAPTPIRPEVATLVARFHAHWPTTAALRAFADDLDDATGDLIASSLILGAKRRGAGLAAVLDGLASTVADDVRIRREINADRATPRSTVRYITMFTAGTLGAEALTGSYVAPYGTGIGQLVLLILLSAYAGCLLYLRHLTRDVKPPRFLPATTGGGLG